MNKNNDVDAVFVQDKAIGIRERQDFAAEFDDLLSGVLGDVPGAGNDHALSLKGLTSRPEHFLSEIDRAVAGSFRADQAASPVQALAGEHAFEAIGQLLVLSKQVSDLASADPDVTGGHIGIRADMPK